MTTTHLLYLHGFRSSPRSMKAQMMAERVRTQHPGVTWWCPSLPPSPAAAMKLVLDGVESWPRERMAVVGSSLGGFYARWLSLQTGCARTVLLNPAAWPSRDLQQHLGEHSLWHNPVERFFFEPVFIEQLRVQEQDIARQGVPYPATPQHQLAIIARGDEVLDWREMQAFCAGGKIRLLPGSNHTISDFDQQIDDVLRFLNLSD